MAVKSKAQISMDERVIDSPDLEQALEEREKRNNSRKALTLQYREADEKAKGLLAEHDMKDGEVVRVGRFRITKTTSDGRVVTFETSPKSRVRIAPAEEA